MKSTSANSFSSGSDVSDICLCSIRKGCKCRKRTTRLGLSLLLPCLALLGASAARANDYCPDRPGLDTPPCIIDPGHVSVEASLGAWTHSSDSVSVTDQVLIGDLAVRVGLGTTTEARLAWSPYGSVRTRDRTSGQVTTLRGSGDITLGIKQNVLDPSGEHLSIALLPRVTLNSGGAALGAGTWSAGLQIPLALPVGHGVSLMLTPEFDAAANSDASGRHFAYGTAAGVAFPASSRVNTSIEVSVMRDEDPAGASTSAVAGASASLRLGSDLFADIGGAVRLNANAPDRQIYLGIAKRF
ncbi:MAG: transporter [Novosphingobium sp.]